MEFKNYLKETIDKKEYSKFEKKIDGIIGNVEDIRAWVELELEEDGIITTTQMKKYLRLADKITDAAAALDSAVHKDMKKK